MRVDLDALVGQERALRVVESLLVLESERDILKSVVLEDRLKLLILAPDLRLETGAAGRESADHFPVAIGEAEHVAHHRVRESAGELRSDADLALPRPEAPSLHDFDVAADVERLVGDAARHDVRHRELVATGTREVDHDVRLRTHQGSTVSPGRDMRGRADDAHGLTRNAAGKFAVRPSPQKQHIVRRSRGDERGDKTVREREHGDENRHHQADAERRERRGDRSLAHTAQVVDERNLHSTLRSACTTGSFAACHAGTIPLATVSRSAIEPPTSAVPGVT